MAAAREIIIPVNHQNLGVAVSLDALPDDENDILQILQAELPPLSLWLDFAKAYLQQGKEEQALRVLEDGCSDEIETYYRESYYDRVSLLCASASFYTRKGRLEKDKKRRDACYDKANFYVGQAIKVDGSEQLPWLTRGHLALARNNVDEADKSYAYAAERRDRGAENVAPTLGAACCAFHRGNYHEALKLYSRALRRHPNGPPATRLGLGATLLRLGQHARARAAFERALALDAECGEAHLGLALCAAADGDGDLAEALAALRAAYDTSPQLSPVLLLLSEHAALCAQQSIADALARASAEMAEAAPLRGAAALQLGRLAHSVGHAAEASKHYNAALALAPADTTPHFGLGQVALLRDELHSATAHLERVAAADAGSAYVRRALGHLYASASDTERRQRAKELLHAAAEADPSDAGVCVELAELMRHATPAAALAQYDKALTTRQAAGQPPSVSLLNNAAVLAAALEDGAGIARQRYVAALEACGAGWIASLGAAPGSEKRIPAGHAALVAFNLACLEEDVGNKAAAATLFSQLQRDCPAEVDVLLRHALAAVAHGSLQAAEQLATEAHTAAPRNPDAVALLGGLAIARRDFKGAQVLLDSFRKGTVAGGAQAAAHAFAYDEYIMVCAANALLADAYRDSGARGGRGDDAEHAARRDNRLERALALYCKALMRAPRNAYAANGVGAVLAERGRLAEARTVFTSVAEAAQGDATLGSLANATLINSAHCHLGMGAPGRAVRLYEQALRKSDGGATDAGVLLCAARALHDWKGEGENHLLLARASLLRALHLSPGDHRARFDVAFVCQEQAVRSLARFRELNPGSDSRLALADSACEELHLASRFFKQLLALGDGRAHGFDAKRTQIHAAFCVDALGKATAARAQAVREQEAAAARRAAQELERAAQEEHLRRVAEARAASDTLALQRLEEQAAAANRKLEADKQRRAGDQEAAAEKEKRRSGKPKSTKPATNEREEEEGPAAAGMPEDTSDEEEPAEPAGDADMSDGEAAGAEEVAGAVAASKPQRRLKRAAEAPEDPEAAKRRALADAGLLDGDDDEVEPARGRRMAALSDDD